LGQAGNLGRRHAFSGMAPKPKTSHSDDKVKDSAVRIKDSAVQLERSTARVEGSADRRTELAADRTVFAAERTYAAWVRTGLFAMASGIGAKALMAGVVPQWLTMTTGTVLMLFSVFCFGAGVWRHLYTGQPPPIRDAAVIHPEVLIFVYVFIALV
jgi:putative membrane protein